MDLLRGSVLGLAEVGRGLAELINALCEGLEPWMIIAVTTAAVLLVRSLRKLFDRDESLSASLRRRLFALVQRLPFVASRIEAEFTKARRDIEHTIHSADQQKLFRTELPEQGMSKAEVLALTDSYVGMGRSWRDGKVSGTVFGGWDSELTDTLTQVFGKTVWSNPLHPDVFPDARKMEAEVLALTDSYVGMGRSWRDGKVVRMTLSLFHGGPGTTGCVTTCGTESILLACLGARNRARELGLRRPTIVAPVTAHPSFDKAAAYFRMRIVKTPVDKLTMKADVKAMRAALSRDTCLLVGSAPSFGHGVMDPLEDIAALGLRHSIPVHVDACYGGFLIPFMEQAGHSLETRFDFRLRGVTSISADTHKYGFATKGSAVLMYSSQEMLHHQYFSQPDWPGGIYATPSLGGSRCGANIAACWAALLFHGRQGYVDSTRRIVGTAKWMLKEVSSMPELRIVGSPSVSSFAFASAGSFSVYTLADGLGAKGWRLAALQFPPAVQMALTPHNAQEAVARQFIQDLREAVAELASRPPTEADGQGSAAIYGTTQAIPDRSLVARVTHVFLDSCLSTTPAQQTSTLEK